MLPQNLVGVLSIKLVWKLWCAFWDRVEMNERDGRGALEFRNVRHPDGRGAFESRLPTRGVKLDKVEVARLRPASKRRRWWAPLTSYAPRPPR